MGHGTGSNTGKRFEDDGFEMLEPTYAFGAIGPFDPPGPPSAPSRAEIEDRSLVKAAMEIEDPWADVDSPPHSHRAAGL